MLAAVPLARPKFDAVGGSHGASISFLGLFGDMDWNYCHLTKEDSEAVHWDNLYTGDPYVAFFVQAHHNIPIRALVDSYQLAWEEWDGLSSTERRAYDIYTALEPAITPTIGATDPNNPDLEELTYRWDFTPKGSGKNCEQEIRLKLSKSRFEYYRRQPRLNGQWNIYAELEMPEVRDLAAEFQKLHANHKWNTYNQACNVLNFVQANIKYSFDSVTTGHEDWPRYPIETLMECTGDCEDVAILCAAIIARLGFQVVLLLYPEHLAFGVAGAENLMGDYVQDQRTRVHYYYGEATSKGWHLGEIPKDYLGKKPEQILAVNILIDDK
jgi:transglutaminase-like putative cysteine protease